MRILLFNPDIEKERALAIMLIWLILSKVVKHPTGRLFFAGDVEFDAKLIHQLEHIGIPICHPRIKTSEEKWL